MCNNAILRIKNPPYELTFWNGIMLAKNQILTHVKWEIGDRRSVFTWDDLWYKDKPLIQIPQYQEVGRQSEKYQGQFIQKYYNLTSNKCFFLKPVDGRFRKQLQQLKLELNSARITMGDKEDKSKWGSKDDGHYSIKEVVCLMDDNIESNQDRQIWEKYGGLR